MASFRSRFAVALVLASSLLTGCGGGGVATAPAIPATPPTPSPTALASTPPTPTPKPSSTPTSSSTPTAKPSSTPTPTPKPSSTPTIAPSPTPVATASATPCTSDARRAVLGAQPRRLVARIRAGDVVSNALYVTSRQSAGRSPASFARGIAGAVTSSLGGESGLVHTVVRFSSSSDARQAEATLRGDPDVVAVAPLHYRHPLGCTAQANDLFFNTADQWYLYRTSVVNASGTDAWSLSHGHGITVAVIDTGVDETNQDLAPKITVKERVVGGVVTTGAGSVQDTDGHGTNVAGLVAASTNNGYGFASTGWEVGLQIYKIFPDATSTSDQQSADTADEARAIRDAVANGASIISMSLGSSAYQNAGFDQAEHDAVEYAISQGVTVVAAAGNDYATSPATDGAQPEFPAGYPNVIAVGASAVQDGVANSYAAITSENAASYSNSGPTLLAPGGDPPSNDPGIDMLLWIEGYSTTTAAYAPDQCTPFAGVCRALFAGTSQATPQVAATVALMMAMHGGPGSLAPSQVSSILTAHADRLPGVPSVRQGAGRLNAYAAVNASR